VNSGQIYCGVDVEFTGPVTFCGHFPTKTETSRICFLEEGDEMVVVEVKECSTQVFDLFIGVKYFFHTLTR
jgi:hypothetical protein